MSLKVLSATARKGIIVDNGLPPSSFHQNDGAVFPTYARVQQKERLGKITEQGVTPKTRQMIVEGGNDDCGDDLGGLGKDVTLFGYDLYEFDLSSEDGDDLYDAIPPTMYNEDGSHVTNIFTAVATLCRGWDDRVDLLELCGGEGRTSQVVFRRGVSSEGNLALVTRCDLGDPNVRKAVNHHLNT